MTRKMLFSEFLDEANSVHSSKYTYYEDTFNGSHQKVKICCPIHGDFWQLAKGHLNGYGCRKCKYDLLRKQCMKSRDQFISDAKKVHGDKYDYSKVEYNGAFKKVKIICKDHGVFYQRPNDHLSGKGCPKCHESKLEHAVLLQLQNMGIDFEEQKHFKWLGKQSLDFYIPSMNLGIECQGKQHFGIGGWSKKFNFNNLKMLDEQKNIKCKKNGIEILYIKPKSYKEPYFGIYNDKNLITLDELEKCIQEMR